MQVRLLFRELKSNHVKPNCVIIDNMQRDLLSYSEAKKLQATLDENWVAFQIQHPDWDLDQLLANSGNLTNRHIITRSGGVFCVAENDSGVYEYPSGLLAWSGGIPESAYVPQDILESATWEVKAIKDNYDW